MTESKLKLTSRILSLSESEDKTTLEGTLLVCPLDESNLNGVGIKTEDALKDVSTLINQPAVAKVIKNQNNQYDFGGHEMKVGLEYNSQTGQMEKTYHFDTQPIGTFITSEVAEMEMDGVKKNVILAKVLFWTRYEKAIEVIKRLFDEGNLHSSWEVSYSDSYEEDGVKWIQNFKFFGVAILGSNVSPAYPSSGIIELSSIDELTEAFTKDLMEENVAITSSVEEDKYIASELEGGNKGMNEEKNKNTVASLTDNDLYAKVREAINATDNYKYYYIAYIFPYEYRAIAYTWDSGDTDFVEFKYSVNSDDTVSITSQSDVKMQFVPMSTIETQMAEKEEQITQLSTEVENLNVQLSEKNEAIVKAGEEIETFKTQIAELTPFKEKVEAIEQAEKEKELSEKREMLKTIATKGGYITLEEIETSEELKSLIENLDEKGIKAEIAERVMKKLDEPKEDKQVEISEVKPSVNVKLNLNSTDDGEVKTNPSSIMQSFLHN